MRLPTEYTENGKAYHFEHNYTQWIRLETLLTDTRVPEDAIMPTALRLIFTNEMPRDILRATGFVLWFYRCGRTDTAKSDGGRIALSSRRAYSFEADMGYIAAAFMEQYGIDLWSVEYMHWWKFRALFNGLHDTKFNEICSYRVADTSDFGDRLRERYEDMAEYYALPLNANDKRRMEQAMSYYGG